MVIWKNFQANKGNNFVILRKLSKADLKKYVLNDLMERNLKLLWR